MLGRGRKVAWKYRRLENQDYMERGRNQWKRDVEIRGGLMGLEMGRKRINKTGAWN